MADRKRVVVALLGLVLAAAGRAGAVEDPFRPPAGPAEPAAAQPDVRPDGLEVSMILRGPDRSTVVVGGQVLGIGDRIEGFTVVAIDPTGVVLERSGKRIELDASPEGRPIRAPTRHSARETLHEGRVSRAGQGGPAAQ